MGFRGLILNFECKLYSKIFERIIFLRFYNVFKFNEFIVIDLKYKSV